MLIIIALAATGSAHLILGSLTFLLLLPVGYISIYYTREEQTFSMLKLTTQQAELYKEQYSAFRKYIANIIACYTISLILAATVPSSIMPYAIYTALLFICGLSACLMNNKNTQIPLFILAFCFTLLFLSNLPLTPILLSALGMSAPLLVATVTGSTLLCLLILPSPHKRLDQQQTIDLIAWHFGFIMLTAVGTLFDLHHTWFSLVGKTVFYELGLAPLSPLIQATALYLSLALISMAVKDLSIVWDKLWLMDTMIDEKHQVKNLHFNILYCLIAHLGALVLRTANLYHAFTNPQQYIKNIGAHCQFLGSRIWHFFYPPIANCMSKDKTAQACVLYRTEKQPETQKYTPPTTHVNMQRQQTLGG